MAIEGWEKGGLANLFDKELRRARMKAGRTLGPKVVKDRRDALIARNASRIGGGVRTAQSRSYRWKKVNLGGKISPYRKKAVQYTTKNKKGLLVVLDHYPHAMAHEDGATLKPKSGKYLFLQDKRRRQQPGDKVFITKGGAVMATKPWRKWSGKGRKPKQPTPRLIGILKKKITIKPMRKEWRLDTIAGRHLKDYRDEIDKNLFES